MGRIPVLLMARELTHGGCERDLTRLALGFRDSELEPHVACFRPGGMRYEEIVAGGVPVYSIGLESFRSFGALGAARRLAAYTKQNGIQLLHAMDVPAACFATPVCRMAGVPAILSCQLSYRSMYSRGERRLMGLADRLADRVVSNCQAVLDDLTAHYGVDPRKATLIYNGIELDRFHPPPGGGRDRSPLPEAFRNAALVVGSVCALRPEKRLDVLIEAFAGLRPAETGARLVIVGGGPMAEPWQALARERGVAEFTHFEPGTPDVEGWMRAMDVFVLTSELESFPNGLLEGMACGCAAVGSNVGGVPEMVGAAGLTFPAGDADALRQTLERLAGSAALRTSLAAEGAKRAAAEFSLARNLERTREVYRETLSAKGR
ncbi:MAG: glycosyltransferase family 4 protein [Acidobacteria bacterium]|nr:glycosyltransferase family 4 protein [Acidobacteriota bacterium]